MSKLHILVKTAEGDLIVVEQSWENTALADRRQWYAQAKYTAKQRVLSAHPGKTINKTTVMGENLTDDEVSLMLNDEIAAVRNG